jgi:hypothetical protein
VSEVWLLYHVPKTGGQTIRDAIAAQVGHGDQFLYLGRWDAASDVVEAAQVAGLPDHRRDRLRFVAGHTVDHGLADLFAPRRVREIVLLRDPAERIVSHYNFFVTRPERATRPTIGFEEWYERLHRRDFSVKWLAQRFGTKNNLDSVAERLSTCTFVARTPKLSHALPILLEAMGLRPEVPPRSNVTGVHHAQILALDGALRDRLARENPGDSMLYRMARTLERLSLERFRAWTGGSDDEGAPSC